MLKKLFPMVLVMFMAVFSTQAFATIVDSWNYTTASEFISSTYNGTNYTATPTELIWGTSTGYGRSGLVIDPSTVTGDVDTYIGSGVINDPNYWATDISLIHNNFPITGTYLTATTIQSTVTLTPTSPSWPSLPASSFTFDIKFLETPNSGWHPSDIFALDGGFPNFNFTLDSQDYFVNAFPSDGSVLYVLPDDVADFVGVAHGSLGFTTPENQSTILPFAFTISTEPIGVPDPSTLLLLGMSLLGLGFYRRRKKQ